MKKTLTQERSPYPGRMPQARGMVAYVRDGYGEFHQPKFECAQLLRNDIFYGLWCDRVRCVQSLQQP